MSNLRIRVLTVEDAEAYWRLREQALENDPRAFGKDVDEHRGTAVEDSAKSLREMPAGSFLLGGFVEETLVCIAMLSREAGRKEKHKGHIYGVYVSPAHRGRQYGWSLLTALLAKAKEDPGLEQILLAVAAGRGAAYRLYRSLGFESYGTEPRALKVGTEYIDEEQMFLFLR